MQKTHRPDAIGIYIDAESKVKAYLASWTPTERLVALRELLASYAPPELSDYALSQAIAESIDG